MAAERGHPRIVEYLIDKGADIDIQDKKGVIMCEYSNHSVATIAYLSLSWSHTIIVGRGFEPVIRGIYVLIQCLSVTFIIGYYCNYCLHLFLIFLSVNFLTHCSYRRPSVYTQLNSLLTISPAMNYVTAY